MTHTRFEVTETDCVGCGLCEKRAPENLRIPPGRSAATVVKQPEGAAETEACHEAADYCPMGALHALEPEAATKTAVSR
ncbi:MAG: ferredoxin [Deltaproteobacteria bacterium]|nr:ferredoxin [Deltaproteobacteria bacterium]